MASFGMQPQMDVADRMAGSCNFKNSSASACTAGTATNGVVMVAAVSILLLLLLLRAVVVVLLDAVVDGDDPRSSYMRFIKARRA